MQGHIGVVSDTKGYYYAMDGSARNMVHYPMSKQKWTYCIKLCDINYSISNNGNTTNSNSIVDTTINISYNGHIVAYKAKNVQENNEVHSRPFLTNLG